MVNSRRSFLARGAALVGMLRVSGDAWEANRRLPEIAAGSTDDEKAQARAARIICDYDAQGIHRTATTVDAQSAHWLAAELRHLGVGSQLEGFSIERVEPQHAFVEVDGRYVSGVPLYDAGCTTAAGLIGTLGDLDSGSDIALVSVSQGDELVRDRSSSLARARQSRHIGVVLVTRSARPGLALLNAESFLNPSGPPMLQVSEVEADWLMQRARRRLTVRLVAPFARIPARALNVVGFVHGRQDSLAPLVVMTPRSGWWNCASERGGGIAAWLEAARAVARERPARSVLFAATTAHELGMIGLDAFLASRWYLARDAHAWIHFGASIGATGQRNLIQASDTELVALARGALGLQGLAIDALAPSGTAPGGEVRRIYQSGGRYISLLADNPLFHLASDRWPEAVDIESVRRQAAAFAALAVRLAGA